MRRHPIITPSAAALLVVLTACDPGPVPARVVRMDSGVADTANLFTLPFAWAGQVPGEHQAAWLGQGTMLIGLDVDSPSLLYLKSDGEHLRPEFTGWSALLSGQVVALSLGEHGLVPDSAVTWMEQASEADLAGLRFVGLRETPTLRGRTALERLAKANPGVGLSFEPATLANEILPLFRPRTLWLGDSVGSALRQLPQQRQVEDLFISAADSNTLVAIRGLPKLRRLMVNSDAVLPANQLPSGLEALTVFEGTEVVNEIGRLPRLRTLILSGSKWSHASDLAALKELRWIGFPTNATQAEFEAIVKAHPDLEVIELLGVDSVTDLSPLRRARHLRALTLDGPYKDLSALLGLTSLEFVGLSKDIWDESPDQVAALRSARPAAVVVKVTPLCLGSGWILLLVPVLILGALAGQRMHRARPALH